ncbi:MAG: transcriptional repressor [Chloroflexi bacterium]|nr:transcriptional repressor [Chloroflexota bacterium]
MSPRDVDDVLDALQRRGHRITDQRRVIMDVVVAQKGQFTANDVLVAVQSQTPSIGRATVFRTLELLARNGLLSRMHENDSCHGYVLCDTSHHHHLLCSRCGLVVNVPDCDLTEQTYALSRATRFRIDGHRLEYFGLCSACQTKAN